MFSSSHRRRPARLRRKRESLLAVERLETRLLLAAEIMGADDSRFAPHAPGELLIGLENGGAGFAEVAQMLTEVAADGWQLPNWDAIEFGEEFAKVKFSSGDILAAAEQLSQLAGVSYAEPNYYVSIDATPDPANNPRFGELWGLHNTGQSGGTIDADIDALEAWDVQTGSLSSVVGIIDTGIDYAHPDLYQNVWINQGEIPTAVYNNLATIDVDDDGLITFWDLNDPANAGLVPDSNGNNYIDGGDVLSAWADNQDGSDPLTYIDDLIGWDFVNNDNDPWDDNAHGTHVAGTIGAVNNTAGVVGVNWQVQMIGLKFLSSSGSGTIDDAISAVQYANAIGVDLTNNSWGGGGASALLEQAIAGGPLFVAAAGNDGLDNDSSPHFPSSYSLPNVISVAATDRNDVYASFSNYGATSVDLAAPGVSILSTLPSGNYLNFDGTSMATPHVAGATALLLAEAERLGLPATDAYIKSALLNTVDPIDHIPANGGTQTQTNGRLNVFRALGYLEDDPLAPSAVNDLAVVDAGLSTVELTWTATDDDGQGLKPASGYDVRYSTSPINDANWASATPASGEPAPAQPGSSENFVVRGLDPDTTYHFALKVLDNVGNQSGLSTPPVSSTTIAGTVLFSDDMENGTGSWSATGLWNQSNFRSQSPNTAWYYGNDSTHTYNTGARNSGTLTRTIDLSDYSEALLRFSEWSAVEPDTAYDRTRVQVSDDGGATWASVFESHGTGNAWADRGVDLNDFVGGSIDVRFWFDTIDSFENNYEGWYIDDVEVLVQPDGPSIYVSPTAGLVTDESGAAASFTIVLSEPPSVGNDVSISISSTDPTEGVVDRSLLVFSASNWDTPQTVTVTGVNDPPSEGNVVVDGDIPYTIVTGPAVSGDLDYNGLDPADVSVVNQDLDVGLSIDDVSIDERDNGTTDFVFTVSLSQLSSDQITVDYATVSGSADGDDYQHTSGTLTIPPNTPAATITVQVNGDADIEPDDTFTVNLVNPSPASNVTITDGEGLGTIIDDDVPRISIDDVTVIEGNTTKTAKFTVSLLKTSNVEVDVDYATSDGTATAGEDYVGSSGTLSIAPGTLSGTIDVTITGDTEDEASETFFVNLSNAPGATIVDDQGIGLIGNDDAPPIQIIDNGDPEFSTTGSWQLWAGQGYLNDVHEAFPGGDPDAATWTFTGLTPGQLYQVSATWTLNGNRASDAPFSVFDDTELIFTEDVNQEVNPLPDVLVSGTPFQHLSVPVRIDSGTLVVELTDDVFFGGDPLQNRLNADAIRIEAIGPGVTITETGNSTAVIEGGASDVYSVVLNAQPDTGETVTIDLGFAPVDQVSTVLKDSLGNTITSLDFTSADWDLPKTVEVAAVNDGDVEGSHAVTITHTASSTDASSAYDGISVPPVTVDITDDDTATVSIAATDPDAVEPGDDGQFTVTMSAVSSVATVINYTVAGSASAGSDYTPLSGSVTVAPLEPTATIDVQVIDNSVFENDETVIVTLTSTDNASVTVDSANDTATVTIADDEPGVRITPNVVNISEEGPTSESYDVLLATQPSGNVDITVTPDNQVDLGAGRGVPIVLDFTPSDWFIAKTVAVTAFDDAVEEGNHISVITHSASGTDPLYNDTLVIDSVTANISDNDASPIQIIDNGDAGFSTTGTWIPYGGQGYLNDVHEGYSGGAEDKAFWTFSGLTAGQLYQVSATWTTHGNRSTDAPYRILDDTEERHFQRVNQELAPRADAVVPWGTGQSTNFEHLGDPILINSGTLIVELSDDANERLNADAIRIEAIGPGVTITETGDSTDIVEGGTSDTYSVMLNTVPSAPVEITVNADPQSRVSLDDVVYSSSVVLSNLTDQAPQTIYVQAYDDDLIEGDHTSTITHSVTSIGSDYDSVSIADIVANISDNDVVEPTFQIEHGSVAVAAGGTTVNLANTYVSPVVITTPNYGQSLGIPAVARLSAVDGNSFHVQLVNPGGGAVAGNIHYIVVEEGVYTVDGVNLEAVKFSSTVTDENNSWVGESRNYANSYTSPVVLGQVMTSNDADWSVFWSRGGLRTAPADGSLYVGKHVGEDPDTVRAAETIGYLVIESGSGTLSGIEFEAAVGADTVRGVTNNANGYAYPLTSLSSPETAIVTQTAMDGGDGSWALLYGGTPLGTSSIQVAVDEDQLSDSERGHTTEQLAYLVLKDSAVPLPSVTIDDAIAATEGSPLVFDLTLSISSSEPIVLDLAANSGTATGGSDFETTGFRYSADGGSTWIDAAGGTQVTFAGGQTAIKVEVDSLQDTIDEPSEAFTLSVSSVVSGAVGDTTDTGTGSIVDDDAPPAVLIGDSVTVTEGSPAVFDVTLSNASAGPIVLDLSANNGTATGGSDFETTGFRYSTDGGASWINAAGGTQVSFAAGQTAIKVEVDSLPDTIDEPSESFTLSVSGVVSGTVGDVTDTGAATINDDDDAPAVTIADAAAVTEGNASVFDVTLSNGSAGPIVLDLAAVNGTATGGSDFETTGFRYSTDGGASWINAAGGTAVTFAAGLTAIKVEVDSLPDAIDESNETYSLSVSGVVSGSVGDTADTGIATIIDDDTAGVTISKSDVYVSEAGETSEIYTVVLTSEPIGGDVSIAIAHDANQVSLSTTLLTFTSSDWSLPQAVTVTAFDDSDTENAIHTSTIAHTAAGADYSGIVVADVIANITDNDAPPPPPVQIIDNGDAGFSTTGTWYHWTGQGYLNDVEEAFPGGNEDKAIWTFSGLTPGRLYQVSATWSTHGNRANDAPFSIWDDASWLATHDVDQVLAPLPDAVESGTNFQHLGTPVQINSGTLIVELSDDVTFGDPQQSRLNADAIRIEAIGPGVTITETGDSTDIVEGGTSDTYSVMLNTVPSAPVAITVNADPQSRVSLDDVVYTSSVVLSNLTDQTPQTIYVQAYDDELIEGDHSGTITHSVTSIGSDYDSISIRDVVASISDDDIGEPTFQIEHGSVAVAAGGTTVNLSNTYVSPVVITTPNYDQSLGIPAVARLSAVGGNSFHIQLVNPGGGPVAGNIHYIVVEEGVYTVDGVNLEAVKFSSTVTDENNSWVGESRNYANSYTSPVVLGQVMTSNDADWSVFWSHGGSRTAPAGGSLFVGKHVGEDPDTVRAAETIGYLVIESSSGTLNGIEFEAAVGADTVRGVTNNANGYAYPLTSLSSPETAIVTQTAMDGGDGSWALLYGGTPLGTSSIQVAVDEDQLSGSERGHTTEQLAYLVLKDSAASSTAQASPLVGQSLADATATQSTASVDLIRDLDRSIESLSTDQQDTRTSSVLAATSTSKLMHSFAQNITDASDPDSVKRIDEALLELLYDGKLF